MSKYNKFSLGKANPLTKNLGLTYAELTAINNSAQRNKDATSSNFQKLGLTKDQYDTLKSDFNTKYPMQNGYGAWDKGMFGSATLYTDVDLFMEQYYVIEETAEPPVTTSQKLHRAQQAQTPVNPGIRHVAVSTYGVGIPVSIGRRVITGNIIDATDLVPNLVGAGMTTSTNRTPIYDGGGGEVE